MKKLNLLVIIVLLSTRVSYAQFTRPAHNEQHDRVVNILLFFSGKKAACKTTTSGERLSSSAGYGYEPSYGAWHRGDSTTCKYTGGKSSDFDFNSMSFLPYSCLLNNGPSGLDLGLVQVVSKNYSNRSMLQYSSAKTWDNNNVLKDTTHIEYNANNDVTYFSDTSLSYTSGIWSKAYNQYDASGKIILSTSINGSPYHNDTVMRYYFYNSSGDLIRDSTLSFSFGYYNLATKNEYYYNSAGNISQIKYFVQSYPTWYEYSRYALIYYNSQQLKKVTISDVAFGHFYQVDSFGWTSGVDYYTYHQGYTVSNDTLVNYIYEEKKSVSPVTLLPDSVTYSDFSFASHPDTTIWKRKYYYDSYGMPLKLDEYLYDPAFVTSDSLTFTGYFHYTLNTTDVAIIGAEGAHLSIFPNPTSGIFTLQLPPQTEDGELFIYDITGKLILNLNVNNSSGVNIDLTDQPPGHYMLKVTSGAQIFRNKIVIW